MKPGWLAVVAFTLCVPITFHGQNARELVTALGCASCHAGLPGVAQPRDLGPPLDALGRKFTSAQLTEYLRNPERRQSGAAARMPNFHFSEDEARALTLFLLSGAGGGGGKPQITAAAGRAIFGSQNCAGCHRLAGTEPWRNGPDLTNEGTRVKPAWLRAYLANPVAIRPFGVHPGSGSRMPDYALSPEEISAIATLPGIVGRDEAPVAKLTPFAMAKAETLIRDRLPCLGCHRLGAEGGRIGPDLTVAGARLQPSFVRQMIDAPHRAAPHSIMPKVPMPTSTLDLIARFLSQRIAGHVEAEYPSLLGVSLDLPTNDTTSVAAIYRSTCAPCHGVTGNGDGFNARHLPVPPARHASREVMSLRSDDTIYDAIHAGAYMLGRSNRMPPFGQSLTRAQIRELVRYIRTLCKCEGPEWSRDGSTGSAP